MWKICITLQYSSIKLEFYLNSNSNRFDKVGKMTHIILVDIRKGKINLKMACKLRAGT